MNSEYKRIYHTFDPVYNSDSRILILGSLPSVKSRENGFYYGHSQNRFWKVIAALTGTDEKKLLTIDGKKEMLLSHRIAIWDVIASCDIRGSSDSSIKNAVPNDISRILDEAAIERIYANGNTAGKLYKRYVQPVTQRDIEVLPSTSPANAAYSLDRLIEIWSRIVIEGDSDWKI